MKGLRRLLWVIIVACGIAAGVLMILIGFFTKTSDLIAYGLLVGFFGFVMLFFVSLFKI